MNNTDSSGSSLNWLSRTFSDSSSSSSSSQQPKPLFPEPGGNKREYVPDLYRTASLGAKKFKAQAPENEDERILVQSLPCDTEAALQHIRNPAIFHTLFGGRLPPIQLYSQLRALIENQSVIDSQLSTLAKQNKIITFSTFSSSNYLIVFLQDFLRLSRHEGVFQRFVNHVLGGGKDETEEDALVLQSVEHSKYFRKEDLRRTWKFEENEIRQLVNGGYLGIQEGEMYCMSLPGAGEFIKCLEKGRKAVLGAIRRAKFGEILQTELEQRLMKKVAPLGIPYHIYDLIGTGEIVKVDTTSGSLLKAKRKS